MITLPSTSEAATVSTNPSTPAIKGKSRTSNFTHKKKWRTGSANQGDAANLAKEEKSHSSPRSTILAEPNCPPMTIARSGKSNSQPQAGSSPNTSPTSKKKGKKSKSKSKFDQNTRSTTPAATIANDKVRIDGISGAKPSQSPRRISLEQGDHPKNSSKTENSDTLTRLSMQPEQPQRSQYHGHGQKHHNRNKNYKWSKGANTSSKEAGERTEVKTEQKNTENGATQTDLVEKEDTHIGKAGSNKSADSTQVPSVDFPKNRGSRKKFRRNKRRGRKKQTAATHATNAAEEASTAHRSAQSKAKEEEETGKLNEEKLGAKKQYPAEKICNNKATDTDNHSDLRADSPPQSIVTTNAAGAAILHHLTSKCADGNEGDKLNPDLPSASSSISASCADTAATTQTGGTTTGLSRQYVSTGEMDGMPAENCALDCCWNPYLSANPMVYYGQDCYGMPYQQYIMMPAMTVPPHASMAGSDGALQLPPYLPAVNQGTSMPPQQPCFPETVYYTPMEHYCISNLTTNEGVHWNDHAGDASFFGEDHNPEIVEASVNRGKKVTLNANAPAFEPKHSKM